LLDVRHRGCKALGAFARIFRVHLSRKRDYAVFHLVIHTFVQFVLDQSCVKILLDALVQIGVHGAYFFSLTGGNHGNLVRDDLCAGE